MNYFGHAHIARLARDEGVLAPTEAGGARGDAGFVLGSMLPDFATMLGLRVSALHDETLHAGARLHERTDAVFHTSPAFNALYREGILALEARGLARGPARGAAHIGVELLLDGTLVGDSLTQRAYLAALDAARAPQVQAAIEWTSRAGGQRWPQLCARLEDQGVPRAYRDPAAVARRVQRALRGRPRLRLAPADVPRVADWLVGLWPRVVEAGPVLLAETRAGLELGA